MTSWIPESLSGAGPIYVRIADQIETAIETGTLTAGSKLPPQRNIAFDIGVTIGTIGRAYQLAIERGLLRAEIGRGTYVLAREADDYAIDTFETTVADNEIRGMETASDLIRMNTSSAPEFGQAAIIERLASKILCEQSSLAIDYVRRLAPNWQEAGLQWLSTGGWTPDLNSIVPAQGVHGAIIGIIAAITQPGEKIAFENLTYAQSARAMALIGRRVVSVGMNGSGLDPDDFERVCAQQHPKALVCVPTLHNPTTAISSEEDRKKIAAIARRFNVMIIEDNIYGRQIAGGPPPIAAFAPELTFHVGGLSKSVSAGLRSSWISCPPHFSHRMLTANKALTGGIPYLLTEIAAQLVLSGEAEQCSKLIGARYAKREKWVREIFCDVHLFSHPQAQFFWMELNEPWHSQGFKSAAREHKILIDSSDEFKVNRDGKPVHFVRVACVLPQSDSEFRNCLITLKQLHEAGPGGLDDYG